MWTGLASLDSKPDTPDRDNRVLAKKTSFFDRLKANSILQSGCQSVEKHRDAQSTADAIYATKGGFNLFSSLSIIARCTSTTRNKCQNKIGRARIYQVRTCTIDIHHLQNSSLATCADIFLIIFVATGKKAKQHPSPPQMPFPNGRTRVKGKGVLNRRRMYQ